MTDFIIVSTRTNKMSNDDLLHECAKYDPSVSMEIRQLTFEDGTKSDRLLTFLMSGTELIVPIQEDEFIQARLLLLEYLDQLECEFYRVERVIYGHIDMDRMNGLRTDDGQACTRVLLTAQHDPKDNGVYCRQGRVWSRQLTS